MSTEQELPARSDIAICGIGLRLPGSVRNLDQYWNVLVNGIDTRGPIPATRWNADGFDQNLGGNWGTQIKHGHFLDDDIYNLDTSFFSYARDEVERADPQQRLLLEVIRECLEDAGEVNYKGEQIGCYIGTFGEDWIARKLKDTSQLNHVDVMGYLDLMLANRVSFEFDFRGPSLVIKTGCSASLVALHEACRAIQAGDATSAIIAGSNIISTPVFTVAMSGEGVLSQDGSCKTFDSAADGYSRGEAVNAVYIKPLAAALRDGNPIHAVIKATGSNCDGKSSGLVAPSGLAQEALMRKVYEDSDLNPNDTAFVECHGTGTATGDPIEALAVGRVFGEAGVYIGSVKPNLGHSEGAAGLSSLVKAVLTLKNRTIPPNIKFQNPNPKIPFAQYKLNVPVAPVSWPCDRLERVSINSFGIGGSNAHAIVDAYHQICQPNENMHENSTEATKQNDHYTVAKQDLLLFSANKEESLKRQIGLYRDWIGITSSPCYDVAYTLAVHREHLPYRAFGVAQNNNLFQISPVLLASERNMEILMVFNGQGGQWPEMGKGLLESDSRFRADLLKMDRTLKTLIHPPSWSIIDELLKPSPLSRVNEPEISQPLCTAIQVALFNKYASLGVNPTAVVGHSSGEIAAAYASGHLSMDKAIIIAYYRGYVTRNNNSLGTMAAVALRAERLTPFLENDVEIACENSPNSSTLSGLSASISTVLQKLKSDMPEVGTRQLKVNMAYHSKFMAPFGLEYERLLDAEFSQFQHSMAQTGPLFVSSVTCNPMLEGLSQSAYWGSNLRSPVKFSGAVSNLLDVHSGLFLEIGPHSTLSSALREICQAKARPFHYTSALSRGANCNTSFLSSVGDLYQRGVTLNLRPLFPRGKAISGLPTYPWNHVTPFLQESRVSKAWRGQSYPTHCLIGSRIWEGGDIEPQWRNILDVNEEPWLSDHKIKGHIIFPFAAYIAMAGEALRQYKVLPRGTGYRIRRAVAHAALTLTETTTIEMVTTLRRCKLNDNENSDTFEFSISSFNGVTWTKNCDGYVDLSMTEDAFIHPRPSSALTRHVDSTRIYEDFAQIGFLWGAAFRGLAGVSSSTKEKLAAATIQNKFASSPFTLHPCTIDICLQLLLIAKANGLGWHLSDLNLPTVIEYIEIGPTTSDAFEGLAWWSAEGNPHLECSAGATVVLSASGIQLRSLVDEQERSDIEAYGAARLHWVPDFTFFDAASLIIPPLPDRDDWELLEEVASFCLLETAERISKLSTNQPHFEKFRDWINTQIQNETQGSLSYLHDPRLYLQFSSEERSAMMDARVHKFREQPGNTLPKNMMTAMLRLMENIEAIYTGEMDTLTVLTREGLLSSIYDGSAFDCANFTYLLAHKKPKLRILEVGAGTGATASNILNSLQNKASVPLYSKYTFTDISAGFFPAAKERLSSFPGIDFRVLDVSKDPRSQDFELDHYDLIIATNVIHATPSLQESLANLRSLLRPDGMILVTEPCDLPRATRYIFGCFPGWWLGEADARHDKPYVSIERWGRELKAVGYTGLDTVVYNDEEPYRQAAVFVSRKEANLEMGKASAQVTILTRSTREQSNPTIRALVKGLQMQDWSISYCSLEDPVPTKTTIICCLDIDDGLFENITEEGFIKLQKFLGDLASHRLLWLLPLTQFHCRSPCSSQSLGLARTLRSERGLDIYTLEIDPKEEQFAFLCAQVLSKIHQCVGADDGLETDREYAAHNGVIHISRFQPLSLLDEARVKSNQVQEKVADMEVLAPSRKLAVGKVGSLKTLHWKGQQNYGKIPDGHVEIESAYAGLNFRDVAYASGLIPSGHTNVPLGIELSGVVRRVGEGVTDVIVGDRVAAFTEHGVSTFTTVPIELVVKIPDGMTFLEAATIPLCFATAIHALIDIGMLTKDMSVLIHSACGGLGLAAIQVAQMMGANIFATVGNEDKVNYLMKEFGIERDHIFSSRDSAFSRGVMRATQDRGVDLVLNSLSGELLHASWRVLAKYGKFLEVGKRDLVGHGQLSLHNFLENRSYCGIDLTGLLRDRKLVMRDLLKRSLRYIENNLLCPLRTVTTLDARNVQQAFYLLRGGNQIGKVVLEFPKFEKGSSSVGDETTLETQPLTFNSDSSYLLIGGLTGLGRNVAVWLAEKGVKMLVILSRSAGSCCRSNELLTELKSLGCTAVLVKGSVTRLDDVKRAVKASPAPIKGVLHFAMAREDSSFADMKWSQWLSVNETKVLGSWNLHWALESQPLDFFWLAGSVVTAIDQPGQANYKAANCFLESFCQYRNSLGLPATVLSICAIEDVGMVADDPTAMRSVRLQGQHLIRAREFLRALEASILISLSRDSRASKTHTVKNWKNQMQALLAVSPNVNHIFLGLRSDKHLDDPENRCNWRHDRRMGFFHNSKIEMVPESGKETSTLQRILFLIQKEILDQNSPGSEISAQLAKEIGKKAQQLMLREEQGFSIESTLGQMGMDSLTSIELRRWIKQVFRIQLDSLEVARSLTLGNISDLIVRKLRVQHESN